MVSLLPLLPLLSTAYMGDLDRPASRLYDQDLLGLDLVRPSDLISRFDKLMSSPLDVYYYRPNWAELLRRAAAESNGLVSGASVDKDTYRVVLDVSQFKPEEVEVKVADKYIVVRAKHEEKKDEQGLISRQFVRKYVIPESVEAEQITSSISSDGVLIIQAPLKQQPERNIKIELTGKPALKPKEENKQVESTSTTPTSSTTEEITVEEVSPENEA